MKKREIIDVSVSAWLCFQSSSPPSYVLKVRIANTLELSNFPLVDLGASYFPGAGEALLGMAQILATVPRTIPQNSEIPYCNGSTSYTVPEDIFLDYITDPVLVSPGNYNPGAVIPWTIPSFWECACFYYGSGGSESEIPGSIENYDKQDIGSNGIIFTPDPIYLYYQEETVGERYVDGDWSAAFSKWSFFYSGADLPSYHIWVDYLAYYPFTPSGAYIFNGEHPSSIDYWAEEAYGYQPRQVNYSGGYSVVVDVWKNDSLPAFFFPRGGTPRKAPSSPWMRSIILLSSISSGIPGIDRGGKSLNIDGIPLSINGIELLIFE
jgi:hypothetical protein